MRKKSSLHAEFIYAHVAWFELHAHDKMIYFLQYVITKKVLIRSLSLSLVVSLSRLPLVSIWIEREREVTFVWVRLAKGPSAAARLARGLSVAARKAISIPLSPMLTSSSREREKERQRDRERHRETERERERMRERDSCRQLTTKYVWNLIVRQFILCVRLLSSYFI